MAGSVEELINGDFRAHVQRRDEAGFKQHIYGSRRGNKRSAEKDLQALRAAAEKAGPDKDKQWSAMKRAKSRLQKLAHGSLQKHGNPARTRAKCKKAVETVPSTDVRLDEFESGVYSKPKQSPERVPVPRASDITLYERPHEMNKGDKQPVPQASAIRYSSSILDKYDRY